MRTLITSLCTLILCFGILAAQDAVKKNETKQTDKKEMVCSHCTKDKKCDMHAQGEMKGMKKHKMEMKKDEKACPHCTADTKCEMHSKNEMKKGEMSCPHCSMDKKCDMHAKENMQKADSTKK